MDNLLAALSRHTLSFVIASFLPCRLLMEKLKKTLRNIATSFAPPVYRADPDTALGPSHRQASQRPSRHHPSAPRRGRLPVPTPRPDPEQLPRKLARHDWYCQRTGGREIECNVLVQLEERMAELREYLYSGKKLQALAHTWDLYEVLGTCVGLLLHQMDVDERERKGVVELRGRVREMERRMGIESRGG